MPWCYQHPRCWVHIHSWWCHEMGTFSALPAIYVGYSLITGEFPAQRPVTWSFDVFFDLRLNEHLIKQSWRWWFKMPSCPLWHHSKVYWTSFIKKYYIHREYHSKKITSDKKKPVVLGLKITIVAVVIPASWVHGAFIFKSAQKPNLVELSVFFHLSCLDDLNSIESNHVTHTKNQWWHMQNYNLIESLELK